MKYVINMALACCMCVGSSFAQKISPCCDIVGINAAKSIITSRNSTTGKVQQFKSSAAGISSLRIGDKLALQNGKITAVNGLGFEPVNGIVSGQVNDGAPCCEIVSLQVNDAEVCCGIVTVKNLTTGELSSFKTTPGIGHTLTLGQSVNLQNGYAMVQSGANATAAQKGMYAFKTGLDSATSKLKENGAETSAEKWVITPGGKGVTGNVTVAFPAGTTWNMLFKTTADKHLINVNNSKSHTMVPGQYNIDFSAVPVLAVPVQKGMNTRLKAGTLHVVSVGGWMLYDESQTKNYVSYNNPMKLGLPIGKYAISINGQFQQVEIKDGEVTEF